MTQKIYSIYKIHRPKCNDPRHYIGVTHTKGRNSIARRFCAHKLSGYAVGCFIRKHDDVVITEIAKNLTKKEAFELEKLLVPSSNEMRKALNLLNEAQGGDCPPHFSELSLDVQQKLKNTRRINAIRLAADPIYREKRSEPTRKTGSLMDPNGVVHHFKGIRNFAIEHGLDYVCIGRVLSGERKHHKGWKLPC